MSEDTVVIVDMRSPQWARSVADPAATCRDAVKAALDVAGSPGGEVSIVLADDEFIRILNRDHRGKDQATNVLAFALEADPIEPGPNLLGDIIVAHETVAREASAFSRSQSDRLAHLVVHAALHLIGYRHDEPGQARAMEGLEVEALARLGLGDPYSMPTAVSAAAGV